MRMSWRKKVVVYGASALIALVLLGAWLQYTHTGRVYGLYAFAAFKAPLSVKYACVKDTNARVEEKFLEPLPLDQASINGLREFWHFSYYRQCMFLHGYGFYGTAFAPSELVAENGILRYRNYFAKVGFTLPSPARIVVDNETDPNMDDYLIASELEVMGTPVSVHMDRSYKAENDEVLTAIFGGFDHKQDYPSPTLERVSSPYPGVLAYQDGERVGYVVNSPNHHIVMIFGTKDAQPILDQIAGTMEWL
jgi:hypothetical protein